MVVYSLWSKLCCQFNIIVINTTGIPFFVSWFWYSPSAYYSGYTKSTSLFSVSIIFFAKTVSTIKRRISVLLLFREWWVIFILVSSFKLCHQIIRYIWCMIHWWLLGRMCLCVNFSYLQIRVFCGLRVFPTYISFSFFSF